MSIKMKKRMAWKTIAACIVALAAAVQPALMANAMTVYESDGQPYDEGYIFIGESHGVVAAHAVGVKAAETGNVMDWGETIKMEYLWDGSREIAEDGMLNTFTMRGNLFFVFEGNSEANAVVQKDKSYIYSDGAGNRGRAVEKIHEIINTNPNVAHWNIISMHGGVAAQKATQATADYYVQSYRNWITYEFPNADCYFTSIATMTKFYKATPDKKVLNNALAEAFPDKFLDYTDFYTLKSKQNRMIDTIHWDDPTYCELIESIVRTVGQKRAAKPVTAEDVVFAVTDVQAVLYTNSATVIYSAPHLASAVILSSCEAGLPVQVTGVTDNGFFRICVSPDGTQTYIPGVGLSQQP